METIIVWLVIVAVGAVFEWVKKKGTSSTRNQSTSGHIHSPAPYDMQFDTADTADTTAKPELHDSYSYKPLTNTDDSEIVMAVENLDAENPDCGSSDLAHGSESSGSSLTDDARRAHFDRWRNAIIYTQILERKF